MIDKIVAEALEKDTFSAVELVLQEKEPLKATKLFGDCMHELYWKRKSLAPALTLGRAGVQHGLAIAATATANPELAEKLRGAAKGLSYDMASFSWPGWNEPGIEISRGDIAVGLDAARTNLRLGKALKREELPMSRAHWMLGAQLLAAKQSKEALRHFQTAADLAEKAGAENEKWLNAGYVLLVNLLEKPGDKAAETAYTEATKRLMPLQGGTFFVEQLETARKVFSQAKD